MHILTIVIKKKLSSPLHCSLDIKLAKKNSDMRDRKVFKYLFKTDVDKVSHLIREYSRGQARRGLIYYILK